MDRGTEGQSGGEEGEGKEGEEWMIQQFENIFFDQQRREMYMT